MEQRDRRTIYLARWNPEITEYKQYLEVEEIDVNIVDMDVEMLIEITGQTDTGYAMITYPVERPLGMKKGDRIYREKPAEYDPLANKADYEVRSVSGKRIVQVTARAMS